MGRIYQVESLLVDTGILYALADRKDEWHAPSVRFASEFTGRLLVPSSVIPEACYLINRFLGLDAEIALVKAFINRELTIEHFTGQDLVRAADLMKKYKDNNIGWVDASIIAIAERLKISRILTTDRRHFGAIRPQHCKKLEMLP
jgi:predicted nucleic acid-binding protein